MITMEERSRKKIIEQTIQLAQIFVIEFEARCLFDVQEN
jgi:hypothetical protein